MPNGHEQNSYYDRLETWVANQYESLASSQQRLHAAMLEQYRMYWAASMAQKKYELEMHRLHRRASQNSSSNSDSPHHSTAGAQPNDQNIPVQFHRYIIPHPWRRIVAEIIDTLIMLFIKVAMLYCFGGVSFLPQLSKLFDSSMFSNTSNYFKMKRMRSWSSLEASLSKLEDLFSDTHDGFRENGIDLFDLNLLFLVDHIGRFLGAIIEAILTSYAIVGSGPGGATIGKWIMNLRVVACDEIYPLPDMVEVAPGTNIGIWRALVRSMLKGTSVLTVLSFICMLLFRYHRCTYDILAGTLVVQPLSPDRQRGARAVNAEAGGVQ